MKKQLLFILLLTTSVLQAYNIVIVGEPICDDSYYEAGYLNVSRQPHGIMNTFAQAWWQITQELAHLGITTKVIGRDNLHLHTAADLLIFWDLPNFSNTSLIHKIAHKSFIVLLEPRTVNSAQYSPEKLSQFNRVFTWDDNFAQQNNYIKYNYPLLKSYKGTTPFAQRKLACMMCGNKWSNNPEELYSERRRIISFFNDNYPELFDVYGPGWHGLTTYKGMAPHKLLCLQNYVFNFCLENTRDTTGYITEKIFDAMEAGTVPIYMGPSNIDEYIPRNCYISYAAFASLEKLKAFMLAFTEQQYDEYQENIRQYLNSPKAQKFAIPDYVKLFTREIRQFLHV